MLRFRTLCTTIILVITMLIPCVVYAGPPEPPGFSEDMESMSMFMQQYFMIQNEIVKLPWAERKVLLLLLDAAGTKWIYARTAVQAAKAWEMLGRVAALTAQSKTAIGMGSTPTGILLSAPLYFSCKLIPYPSLHGYMLDCSETQKYWCQRLRCVRYWIDS